MRKTFCPVSDTLPLFPLTNSLTDGESHVICVYQILISERSDMYTGWRDCNYQFDASNILSFSSLQNGYIKEVINSVIHLVCGVVAKTY